MLYASSVFHLVEILKLKHRTTAEVYEAMLVYVYCLTNQMAEIALN